MAKRPIFLIGDTAWMLWKASNADIDTYIETRAAQGFNMINLNCLFDVANNLSANQSRDNTQPASPQLVDSGTASAISTTTVTLESGHSFSTNSLVGYQLRINSASTNSDQDRIITANTNANPSVVTLTGSSWGDGTPTGTIQYGIAKPWTDPVEAKFQENYMQIIDYIIDKAATEGMYVYLVTMWGGDFFFLTGNISSPSVVRSDIATALGNWIGNRYKDKPNVIHALLGEYHENKALSTNQVTLVNAFGNGIEAVAPNQLKTIHPDGGLSSSDYFNSGSTWLDFHSLQTYQVASNSDTDMTVDYNTTPARPIGNAEPAYEEGGRGVNDAVTIDGYYCRYEAYNNVFQGAAYYTYGNNNVWRWINSPLSHLTQAGALSMPRLKNLVESRPLVGAPSSIVNSSGTYYGTSITYTSGGTYQVVAGDIITGATSGATATVIGVALSSGTWAGGDAGGTFYLKFQSGTFQSENLNVGANSNVATIAGNSSASFTTNNKVRGMIGPGLDYTMVYFYGSAVTKTLNLNLLTAATSILNYWWFNPRDGLCYTQSNTVTTAPVGQIAKGSAVSFTSPGSGSTNDWVLVVEDPSITTTYGQPGA